MDDWRGGQRRVYAWRMTNQHRHEEIAKLRKRLSSLERGEFRLLSGAGGPMRDITNDEIARCREMIKFYATWLERQNRGYGNRQSVTPFRFPCRGDGASV